MAKKLSLFLGVMILIFGVLKFVDPFRSWYLAQIETSGLPQTSYLMGIVGEILVGLLLIVPSFLNNKKVKIYSIVAGSAGLIGIMIVAVYVHLLPAVPAEVLPLKIKPPIIPLVVLLATIYNLYQTISLRV